MTPSRLLIASIILPLTYFAWSLIGIDRAPAD